MQDLFSNEFFQLSLEDLEWTRQQRGDKAFEFIKLSDIEEQSKFFAMMLRLLTKPIKLGDYTYYLAGSNRIERLSPLIKPTTKTNKFFTVSQVFHRKAKIELEQGKGVVIEKEAPKVLD